MPLFELSSSDFIRLIQLFGYLFKGLAQTIALGLVIPVIWLFMEVLSRRAGIKKALY
jgi:hypothetical protein